MPVQYAGIVEEHNAVRQRAGMFDVSHMGRFEVHGPDAGRFLRYVSTWDMTRLAPGEGHYSAACNEDGGILDDIYVFCLGPERYLVVVNASNAEKMLGWLEDHIGSFDARLVDRHAVDGYDRGARAGGARTAARSSSGSDFVARSSRDAAARRSGRDRRSSPRAPATPAKTASSS